MLMILALLGFVAWVRCLGSLLGFAIRIRYLGFSDSGALFSAGAAF
jgi:hypothetical protein